MFTTMLDAHIGASLSRMIEAAFGPCAAKRAAPYADASHRTLEKAIQGRTELGAWKLLKMVRHPEFRAALRAYLDHIELEEANIASRIDDIAAQRLRGGAGVASVHGGALRPATVRAAAQEVGDRRRGVRR